MSDPLVIWINPRCSTCRRALEVAAGAGVEVVQRRYLEEPPSADELREVLRLAGTEDPWAIARRKEPRWDELALDDAPAEEVIAAMAAEPRLIERPVAIRGGRAIVARPPGRLAELLREPEARAGGLPPPHLREVMRRTTPRPPPAAG